MSKNKINWTMCEYLGVEVLTAPSLPLEEILALDGLPEGFKPEPIREKSGIQVGSVVLIPGLFGGLGVYSVVESDGKFYGQSGGMMGVLEFGEDARNCWVCSGMVNTKATQKLELSL